jgi:hypothetical protein
MDNLKTKKLIRPLTFANHTSAIEVDAKSNILVINEYMREGSESTVVDTAINLNLNASGVVPKYVGSKNHKHYFTFIDVMQRDKFLNVCRTMLDTKEIA